MRKVLLLLVAGCSMHHVKLTPTNPSPTPLSPRLISQVEVFTSSQPQRPFVEVAVITSDYGDAGKDIDAIQSKASDYGCDAVVFKNLGSTEEMNGRVQSSKIGAPSHAMHGEAVSESSAACVVYTGPAPVATLPSSEPPPSE